MVELTDDDRYALDLGYMRLAWIRNGGEPCQRCLGTGVLTYASTSTWRGGCGGSMLSSDVCDRCWGSGIEGKPWPSHAVYGVLVKVHDKLLARATDEQLRAELERRAKGGASTTRPPTDSPDGFDRAPDRYTGQGRETVDRMRDRCWHVAATELNWRGLDELAAVADLLFREVCESHALKYRDRLGRKGDADEDRRKLAFWTQMAEHVATGGRTPDPRAGREGFVPYTRREWTESREEDRRG